MPTKSEAAEALYATMQELSSYWANPIAGGTNFAGTLTAVRAALDAYSTTTPDALPAEVQRVVEAAVKMAPVLAEALEDAYDDEDYSDTRRFCSADVDAIERAAPDFIAAVDAYRSTQPEPLSARLARLGKGAVVELLTGTKFRVVVNLPDHKELVCEFVGVGEGLSLIGYRHVTAIISESP